MGPANDAHVHIVYDFLTEDRKLIASLHNVFHIGKDSNIAGP